jgi:hypothetical protein
MGTVLELKNRSSMMVDALVTHLLSVGGEEIGYAALCEVAKCKRGEVVRVVYRAKKRLLRVHKIYFEPLPGIGIRRGTPEEKTRAMVGHVDASRRKVKGVERIAQAVTSDEYEKMPPALQQQHNVSVVVARAMVNVSGSSERRALAEKMDAHKTTKLSLAEAFRAVLDEREKK